MTGIRFALPLAVAMIALLGVPVAAQKVVRVGGNVRAPRQVKRVNPVYPEEAKKAGISGVVILDIRIGTGGSVVKAGHPLGPVLDQAALDAVYQWEYEPTLLNGEPIEVEHDGHCEFRLELVALSVVQSRWYRWPRPTPMNIGRRGGRSRLEGLSLRPGHCSFRPGCHTQWLLRLRSLEHSLPRTGYSSGPPVERIGLFGIVPRAAPGPSLAALSHSCFRGDVRKKSTLDSPGL